jgi:hypothetical protein
MVAAANKLYNREGTMLIAQCIMTKLFSTKLRCYPKCTAQRNNFVKSINQILFLKIHGGLLSSNASKVPYCNTQQTLTKSGIWFSNKLFIMTYRPDDGVTKHLRNAGHYLPDYTVQHPRRQPSSYSST